jgi:hypothetical protein
VNGRLWGSNVSEGGLHPNPNVCWQVFSQLRAGHERRGGSVDPVDTTGCVGLLAPITGSVYYLHTHLTVESHGQPG